MKTLRWLVPLVMLTALAASAAQRAFCRDGTYSLVPPPSWAVEKTSITDLHLSSGPASLDITSVLKAEDVTSTQFHDFCRDKLIAARWKLLSQSDTTIGGNPTLQNEMVGVADDVAGYQGRFLVICDRHRTWFVTCSAPQDKAEMAFSEMEDSLATMQFK